MDRSWIFCAEESKVKIVPLAGKAMASIFRGTKEIVSIDYLEKGKLAMEEYYTSLELM